MMDGYGPMMGWGWGWMFWILILIGVGLLAVLVIRLVRDGTNRRGSDYHGSDQTPGPLTARQILEQRYARGEIDTDEYRQRLQVLEEGR